MSGINDLETAAKFLGYATMVNGEVVIDRAFRAGYKAAEIVHEKKIRCHEQLVAALNGIIENAGSPTALAEAALKAVK